MEQSITQVNFELNVVHVSHKVFQCSTSYIFSSYICLGKVFSRITHPHHVLLLGEWGLFLWMLLRDLLLTVWHLMCKFFPSICFGSSICRQLVDGFEHRVCRLAGFMLWYDNLLYSVHLQVMDSCRRVKSCRIWSSAKSYHLGN